MEKCGLLVSLGVVVLFVFNQSSQVWGANIKKDGFERPDPDVVGPGLIKITGLALDKCAKACLEESRIKCQYFKYVNGTGDCYLSETDHPTVRQRIDTATTAEKPTYEDDEAFRLARENENMIKLLRRKLDTLDHRVKELQEIEISLKGFEEESASVNKDQNKALDYLSKGSAKEQQAMVLLREKIYTLTEKAKSIFNEITSMKSNQQSAQVRLNRVSSGNTNITHQLVKLASIVDVLAEDLEGLKSSLNGQDKHFKDLQTSNEAIEERLNTLKRLIDKKGSTEEAKFAVNEMKTNQVDLANAVSKMAAKEQELSRQILKENEDIGILHTKISSTAAGKNAIADEVEKIKSNIMEIQSNLQQLADPVSPQNKKWRHNLELVQSSVLRLADSNKKLSSELKSTKQDLGALLEDLTTLQLGSQEMKLQLASNTRDSAQLKSDVGDLKSKQDHAPSMVQMAKMETNILKSLAVVEREQKRLSALVDDYDTMTQKLKTQVESEKDDTDEHEGVVSQLEKGLRELIIRQEQTEAEVRKLVKKDVKDENVIIQTRLQKKQEDLGSKMTVIDEELKDLRKSLGTMQSKMDNIQNRDEYHRVLSEASTAEITGMRLPLQRKRVWQRMGWRGTGGDSRRAGWRVRRAFDSQKRLLSYVSRFKKERPAHLQPVASCPPNYTAVGGSCYRSPGFAERHSRFQGDLCHDGTHLARPDSIESQNDMATFLNQTAPLLEKRRDVLHIIWMSSITWKADLAKYVWTETGVPLDFVYFWWHVDLSKHKTGEVCINAKLPYNWIWLPKPCVPVYTTFFICEIKLQGS
ncbi:hypothetical protein ScPMuIL_014083 [Solemya velum]